MYVLLHLLRRKVIFHAQLGHPERPAFINWNTIRWILLQHLSWLIGLHGINDTHQLWRAIEEEIRVDLGAVPTAKLWIKFSSWVWKAEDTLAACKRKSEAVPKAVIPFLQDFVLPAGKGTRPRALRNFLPFLSTALTGAFSLSCIAFWYSKALGQQPPKKNLRSFQRVRPSHNHPLWKQENAKTDARKLGIRKEGRVGTAWLSVVILNRIGESYRPWIKKETNLNFQCKLWDQHLIG